MACNFAPLYIKLRFAMTIDLLLGYNPNASINMLLTPFRLMFRIEIVIIIVAILYIIIVEYNYAAYGNNRQRQKYQLPDRNRLRTKATNHSKRGRMTPNNKNTVTRAKFPSLICSAKLSAMATERNKTIRPSGYTNFR
ncbi:hypothetical protein PM3016_6223 [Paenibacillus mucilaginosus 3016]|uniref:Uncharacterized protein n=1 Tax=Paenibacillus mucilaginosus 3016 TaxID=1116391 RepID=H6NRX6_9BACL|nr:hypothetical protein PM3016_6223 [Paenibacillus mucilaginosus 3016]